MTDNRDHDQDPRTTGKKKIWKWSVDDLVYSQRLFFLLLVLTAGILFFNPWVLYNIEIQDEKREENQTQHIIDNQDRNFITTVKAIEKLDELVGLIQQGQINANIRGNNTQANFNETLQHVDQGVIAINRTVVEEATKRANLSHAETEELVNQLRIVYDSVIPEINTTLISIDEVLDQQANRSLQQDNNRKITEVLNILRNQSNP